MQFMIKTKENISQLPKKKTRYKITTSLLNSWQNIWDCEEGVHEKEDDEISYEDKLEIKRQEKKQEFINYLNRLPIPDNEAMKKGREFEDIVCAGLDPEFSKYVKGGAFQVKVARNVDIDGIPLTFYGILDVLKAGRIMDIKRTGHYQFPKYKSSHQHAMYMYLVPEAIDFTYLVADDNIESKDEEKRKKGYHLENYIRENSEDIVKTVSQFLTWLKANDLFEIFKRNWVMYEV